MTLFYWHIVLNLGLATLLAMSISRLRIREGVGLGDGGKLTLKKAIRPHANALEHALAFSFVVFVAASLEVNERYLLILVASFFVSRLVHAASYRRRRRHRTNRSAVSFEPNQRRERRSRGFFVFVGVRLGQSSHGTPARSSLLGRAYRYFGSALTERHLAGLYVM